MHTVEQTAFSLEYSLIEIQGLYLWHSGSELIEMSLKKKRSRLRRLEERDVLAKLSVCKNTFFSKNTAPSCRSDQCQEWGRDEGEITEKTNVSKRKKTPKNSKTLIEMGSTLILENVSLADCSSPLPQGF